MVILLTCAFKQITLEASRFAPVLANLGGLAMPTSSQCIAGKHVIICFEAYLTFLLSLAVAICFRPTESN